MAVATDNQKATFIDHLARHMSWPRFFFALGMFVFWAMIVFPFFWMVSSSFKTRAEIAARVPTLFPAELNLDAYQELFNPGWEHFQNFAVNIFNSLLVAIPTALIAVVLSMMGAYAIARLKFWGKDMMLNSILMIYLFPGILLIIPLFAMLAQVSQWEKAE